MLDCDCASLAFHPSTIAVQHGGSPLRLSHAAGMSQLKAMWLWQGQMRGADINLHQSLRTDLWIRARVALDSTSRLEATL